MLVTPRPRLAEQSPAPPVLLAAVLGKRHTSEEFPRAQPRVTGVTHCSLLVTPPSLLSQLHGDQEVPSYFVPRRQEKLSFLW